MPEKETFICPNCHVGRLELTLTTYAHQYGPTMICVPNTPGWKCDVCHACHFDPAAVQRVELLIRQAGPPPNRYQPAPRPARVSEPRTEPRAEPKPQSAVKARSKAK